MQVQQKNREGGKDEGEIQVKIKLEQKLLEGGKEEEIQVKRKLKPKMLEEEGEEEEGEELEGDWLNY